MGSVVDTPSHGLLKLCLEQQMGGTVLSRSHGLFAVLRRSHRDSLALISPPAPPHLLAQQLH